jgi:hypothetical protein
MSDAQLSTWRRVLARLTGKSHEGERDLWAAMGYPDAVSVQEMRDRYDRGDIAARIIDAFPDATWKQHPTFKASEEFIRAFATLEQRIMLWNAFHRLDRLTGIGHYGVLFLGLDGREDTEKPVTPGKKYQLMYVQPHGEMTAQISAWENDPKSPRFGRPKLYRLTTGANWAGTGGGQRVLTVHHSRVIHVAERENENNSIGTPRLERIWNRLMDLEKLLGGSAEIYWQNSAMLLAFLADAGTQWEPEDKKEMAKQIEEMQHGLRRSLRLTGVDVKNVAPGLMGSDPANAIDKQLDMIAGAEGMPKRILIGSERGELASSQDEENWTARIVERREQFAGPMMVEKFVKAGQRLGFLPDGAVFMEWPKSDNIGESTRADIGLKKVQALTAYAQAPGAELIVAPETVRKWLGETGPLPSVTEPEPLDETNPEVTDQFNGGSNGA